jgi:hypothetical protein
MRTGRTSMLALSAPATLRAKHADGVGRYPDPPYPFSTAWLLSFNVRLFSVTVRTTCSGAPDGISATSSSSQDAMRRLKRFAFGDLTRVLACLGKDVSQMFPRHPSRVQKTDMPDLADPVGQASYLAAIEACEAKVALFDNLSCLRHISAERPESGAEAWEPIAKFIRRLNRLGIAVIVIHHTGKSGTQRGSSAHTDGMDTVLRLLAPGGGQEDPLAELDVEIHFEKHRQFGGDAVRPLRAKVLMDEDGNARWESVGSDPLADDVARLRKEGKSIREIAAALRRSKKAVEKALSRAKARGLLPLGGDRE